MSSQNLSGRRVLIGVPSLTGVVDVHFAHSVGETIRLCTQIGCDVRTLYMSYDSLIQRVRNDLVLAAIENNFDDLVFIDADQGWKPEWVPQLLKYPVDCVGGAVVKKKDVEDYNVLRPLQRTAIDGLYSVGGLGTGFMRLTKRAMVALLDRSEEYRDDSGKVNRWMFDVGPVNGRLVGEDIAMATKLRDAGIPVHLDPSITCWHIGHKVYSGNFAAWLENLRTKAA